MKSQFLSLIILLFYFSITAQDNLVLVEHFTNTYCPICSSSNPGLNSVIKEYSDQIVNIRYHPSVPYSQCPLYQYNKSDNGARQVYYGIFGTPTMFINGKASSSSSINFENDLVAALENEANPAQLNVVHGNLVRNGNHVDISIDFPEGAPGTYFRLFVALAETNLDFQAQNGERDHFNVMRKFISSNTGDDIDLARSNTTTMSYNFDIENEVKLNKAYVIAFIQEIESKIILGSSSTFYSETVSAREEYEEVNVYPNPASELIRLNWDTEMHLLEIYNSNGKRIKSIQLNPASRQSEISVSHWPKGLYFCSLTGNQKRLQQKILIF